MRELASSLALRALKAHAVSFREGLHWDVQPVDFSLWISTGIYFLDREMLEGGRRPFFVVNQASI
jgi:hypothetical protein